MAAVDITDAFLGHSKAAATIRCLDWSNNPLGPVRQWSQSLRTIAGAVLESAFPQCIVWGPQRITIHNDAFLPILGRKPPAQGRPFHDVWHEAWDTIAPLADRAYVERSSHRRGRARRTRAAHRRAR